MSRSAPAPDCRDVSFNGRYVMSEAAEVALEDYARALFQARAAEAGGGGGDGVSGLHLCAPQRPPVGALWDDMEAFARDLAARSGGSGGLGWD